MAKRQIAVADCETDPFKINRIPAPFLWGFYDGFVYIEFNSTEKFMDYLKSIDEPLILYAHNGGKFDWHFIKNYIPADQKLMVINGRLASFKIGNVEFRDSYNLLPVPLSAYQKTEIDYNIFEASERNKPENKKLISDYLKDDCLFLFDLLETFINDYGLNLTLAGSAMKFWRKNFYKGKSFSSSKHFFESMHPYYYGGRVECFEKGIIDKRFSVYDINSAYPFAMKANHAWGTATELLDKLPRHYEQCFIRLTCISKGAFPFRDKTGLSFPNDDEIREYTITGWELKTAKELKLVKKIKIIYVIRFKEIITFTDYVDHFYNLKAQEKNGSKARYVIAKLFLNSLYGKFASNPQKYKEYYSVNANEVLDYQENTSFVFTAMLGDETAIVEQPLPEDEQRFYNVATAASVTGFVRAYLLKYLTLAGNNLYCDTDSIATYGNSSVFQIGEKLGEWEKEGDFVQAAIGGKKLYSFKGIDGKYKNASKGVKLSEKEIFCVAKGENVLYASEVPTFSIKNGINFITRNINLT